MDEQKVVDAVEEAFDAAESKVEEIVPEVVQTIEVVRNNPYILAGVAVIGLATGGFVGYRIASRKMTTKYEAIIADEVKQAKEHYAKVYKKDQFESPAAAVELLIPVEEQKSLLVKDAEAAQRRYSGRRLDEEIGQDIEEIEDEERDIDVRVSITKNVFENRQRVEDDGWDQQAEEASRSEDFPYIIHVDEFTNDTAQYEQVSVTYYEGDETLADEQDKIIDDMDGAIGGKQLLRWGHGSGDNNVVYIRNNKRGLDFEILRSEGKYGVEVMGFDD